VRFIYIQETIKEWSVSRVFQTFLQDFVLFDAAPDDARRSAQTRPMTLTYPSRRPSVRKSDGLAKTQRTPRKSLLSSWRSLRLGETPIFPALNDSHRLRDRSDCLPNEDSLPSGDCLFRFPSRGSARRPPKLSFANQTRSPASSSRLAVAQTPETDPGGSLRLSILDPGKCHSA
jgi:hypothetical protein